MIREEKTRGEARPVLKVVSRVFSFPPDAHFCTRHRHVARVDVQVATDDAQYVVRVLVLLGQHKFTVGLVACPRLATTATATATATVTTAATTGAASARSQANDKDLALAVNSASLRREACGKKLVESAMKLRSLIFVVQEHFKRAITTATGR